MTTDTGFSDQDMLIFEMRKRSTGVAYVLWGLSGTFGGHYFYLGNTKKALWRLILTMIGIGVPVSIALAFIDLFTLSGEVYKHNLGIVEQLSKNKGQDLLQTE